MSTSDGGQMDMEVERPGPVSGEHQAEEPETSLVEGAQAPSLLSGRIALLQEAFDKSLDYGLRDPSREEFGDNFHDLDDSLVDALFDTYQQMLGLVRSHCQVEFEAVCVEHDVAEQLRLLEQEDAAQPSTSDAPTPLQSRRPLSGEAAGAAGAADAGGDASTAAVTAVVNRAEEAARLHALRQEAAHLQDVLERARTTEARLTEALALRQGSVDKMAATYNRVVSDVKQVYDITRVWPTAPRLGGPSA